MRRHDLVYLQRDAAFATPCAAPGDASWQAARDWIAAGRPLVAARQPPGSERLHLGLSLPLTQQRKRLSIDVEAKAIARIEQPLSVARCCSRLPAAQAAVLTRLAEQATACGAGLGVFGSLAWEVLSGEAYRHADSDIDLICDVATVEQFDTMLAALQQAAGELPCRLDGELRFPDGNAVAWREMAAQYRQPSAPVLIKGEHGVDLQPVQAVLAALAEACCHA
ncbi:malonate decarboxylase holo-[acyl-carrier-protein] synthase [Dechloromonas sp. XY25]|uniref:Malonate decarboxylase holo-[acyl-carrier-protein] synthase n=1 Tax=Dechloromonas hankyongensis TaxID=2908002 RepID=A0ABS9JXI0_9RHOO|nr:malonate decarboxylase holo-[acyl-carrier-protein] synthase [Dechloromonas hankyongensis]MCG2575622.1 malonate decarboxylase holo-[acyl-carrier-protein] synthase [Dechloromonas hankyongensis]